MKRIFALFMILLLAVPFSACEKSKTDSTSAKNQEKTTEETSEGRTAITLTIGDKVFDAYLNDSKPAKSLLSQLPMTVTLSDSGNDFCGDNIDIDYSDSDLQSGYKNGDLAFWPSANNFVIFVNDEENSADTDNLVILGGINESQEALDSLEGEIDVTIARADDEKQTEEATNTKEASEVKVRITVGDTQLYATMENNATTQAIVEQMPMTLPMMNLYGREMCYRYGANALPTDHLQSDGYEVGDIAYWAPGGSLVILYKQNGEEFERQHLGHIDSGVEVFENTGDTDVKFELVEE
jgi:hypothetical protein